MGDEGERADHTGGEVGLVPAALRHRDFRLFWGGVVLSAVSTAFWLALLLLTGTGAGHMVACTSTPITWTMGRIQAAMSRPFSAISSGTRSIGGPKVHFRASKCCAPQLPRQFGEGEHAVCKGRGGHGMREEMFHDAAIPEHH